MCFENILRFLGHVNFQILGQFDVVLRQEIIADDFLLLLPQAGQIYLLPGAVEGQLFLNNLIGALSKEILDLLLIIQLDGDSQSIQILLQPQRNIIQNAQSLHHFLVVDTVVGGCRQVHVDFVEVGLRDVSLNVLQLVDDQEQIDGVVLGVVVDEVWNDLVHQLD